MIGLFDRDVFLKLCCCNLWFEAVEALGVTQPYRLAATSSARSNRKKITQMLADVDPEESIQRTQDIVDAVPVVPDDLLDQIYGSAAFQEMSDIEGIDGGEQVLAAILIDDPEGRILLSGDKRFVQAFRENLPDRWDALGESIISFEACMLAIEDRYGFDFLVERVLPVRHCDGSLRIAIGHEPNAEDFRNAMTSFNPCRIVEVAAAEVVVVEEEVDK
ncbi:hypothetical protein [Rhizobium sp. CNPSo 3490]|uniref:hypothetical protein n=1 Tax=Rhizobium sp. CNPSo 3490 TaxID=3021407 RepID=UPI00255199A8|nr:hypothetical protein [Rhizobium sp. CNPSo 3490]MDK4732012.1 hypothetical protein [Rhizobium sp. CNPSo 3490]